MYKFRTIFILILFFLIIVFITYRATVLTLGEDNNIKVNSWLMNRSPFSIHKLNEQAEKLNAMTANIENTSLGDIRKAFSDTVTLVKEANLELNAQYDAWTEIKLQIEKDDFDFKTLRQQMSALETTNKDDLLKLKKLFDSAERPSIYQKSIDYVLSFAFGLLSGILSSLLASAAKSYWRQKRLKTEL